MLKLSPRFLSSLRCLASGLMIAALPACGSTSTTHTPDVLSGKSANATAAANNIASNSSPAAASAGAGVQGAGASTGSGGVAAGAASGSGVNISSMTALMPDVLRQKLLTAFGAGSTSSMIGGKQMDYLTANSTAFTGTIGGDASQPVPSKLVNATYFMALNTLGAIVGENYAAALKAGGSKANDCTTPTGAQSIIQTVYPSVSASDLASISAMIVTACQTDGAATAAQAIVSSYATVYNSSI